MNKMIRIFITCVVLLTLFVMTSATHPQAANNDVAQIVLVGAGDIAECKNSGKINAKPFKDLTPDQTAAARTAELIRNLLKEDEAGPRTYVFTLGDNSYPDDSTLERCYGPTWGEFLPRTFPILGNHDRENVNPNYSYPVQFYSFFKSRFNELDPHFVKNPNEYAGYYRRDFDQGPWVLLMLDSTYYYYEGNFGFRNAGYFLDGYQEDYVQELAWLQHQLQLAKEQGKCIIAMWHHPHCPSCEDRKREAKRSEAMQPIWSALVDKASLALTGHFHSYRKFFPMNADLKRDDNNGLRQIVVGTGGAFLDNRGFDDTETTEKIFKAFGVIRLRLFPASESKKAFGTWEFLSIEGSPPDANDSGTFECR